MTYLECIQYVDSINPNAYTADDKCRWLRECEGKVYTQLFLQQPVGFSVTRMSEIIGYELAIPAPYNKIYPLYLQAMIHYANAEPDRYSMSMSLFNEAWHELCVWFGQDYDISDRARNRRITVRFGGQGTDEGDYTEKLLTIPERCAFAAGRIVVKTPFIGGDPENPEDVTGKVWFRDPDNEITGSIKFYKRGSYGIKMLLGDIGGTDIGVNIDAMDGEAYLTGVLCLPEEQFYGWPEKEGYSVPLEDEEEEVR